MNHTIIKTSFLMTGFLLCLASPAPAIDPIPGAGPIREIFATNFADFEKNIPDSLFDSAVEDYRVDEDVFAYYVSARYENGPLRIVGGFRFEETENRMRGNLAEEVEAGSTYNGVLLTDDSIFISSVYYKRDYNDVYPSINLRYEAGEDVVIRAGPGNGIENNHQTRESIY